MATVVDALIVTLGLDTTDFQRGQKQNSEDLKKSKEDANATAKAIEASGKTAAQFFSRLRNEALLLFAAFTGANSLKQFVENLVSGDAGMSRLAKQLNMTTEDLTAWTSAIERTGGSATAAAGTFQSLEDNIQNLRLTGQSNLLPFFRAMGVAMLDAQGNARPLKDILLDLAKWAEGKDPAMVHQMFQSIGLDPGTINMLMKGRDAVAALIDESKKLGVTSDEEGKRAEQLQHAWRSLEQAATSLGRTILNDLSPKLIDVGNYLVKIVEDNKPLIEGAISNAIDWILTKATELYNYLSTVDWTAVWKTLIEWLTQVQLSFLTFFTFLKEHWPEIKQSVSEFASAVQTIAVAVDKVVESTVGWTKVAEVFFAVWAIGKFAPIIGGLTAILRLITGISTGILGVVALAPLMATGFAGGEDKQFSDEKNEEFLKNRGGPSGLARWLRQTLPSWMGGSGLESPTADTSMSPTMQAFLNTLAKPESGGDYTIKQGGSHFQDFSQFPEGVGPGGTSTAAGRYQFISKTWHDIADKLGLKDFSPENQDKAASYLVRDTYRNKTGGDIEEDIKSGKTDKIADALKGIWPSLPGGSQSHQTGDEFAGRLAKSLSTMGEKPFDRPTGDPNALPTPPKSPVSDLSTGARTSPVFRNSTANTTTTSEVNINGPINVQTQATDATGIAAGLADALKNSLTVQQANGGLN